MNRKVLTSAMLFVFILSSAAPSSYAVGAREASASFLLPTTGQAMNGQLGNKKTKVMAGIEVAGVTTLAILGGTVGGPVIWAALGPLIANHAWSSVDAYRNAQFKVAPGAQEQMLDAQKTLDISRQRRFEREQLARTTARDRIRLAGEQAALAR